MEGFLPAPKLRPEVTWRLLRGKLPRTTMYKIPHGLPYVVAEYGDRYANLVRLDVVFEYHLVVHQMRCAVSWSRIEQHMRAASEAISSWIEWEYDKRADVEQLFLEIVTRKDDTGHGEFRSHAMLLIYSKGILLESGVEQQQEWRPHVPS